MLYYNTTKYAHDSNAVMNILPSKGSLLLNTTWIVQRIKTLDHKIQNISNNDMAYKCKCHVVA